jgi:hypothetical protein
MAGEHADAKLGKIHTDYFLALRPEPSRPDGPTVAQRLRSLLKVMKRSYGFRCISIAPDLPAELPATDPPHDEPPLDRNAAFGPTDIDTNGRPA